MVLCGVIVALYALLVRAESTVKIVDELAPLKFLEKPPGLEVESKKRLLRNYEPVEALSQNSIDRMAIDEGKAIHFKKELATTNFGNILESDSFTEEVDEMHNKEVLPSISEAMVRLTKKLTTGEESDELKNGNKPCPGRNILVVYRDPFEKHKNNPERKVLLEIFQKSKETLKANRVHIINKRNSGPSANLFSHESKEFSRHMRHLQRSLVLTDLVKKLSGTPKRTLTDDTNETVELRMSQSANEQNLESGFVMYPNYLPMLHMEKIEVPEGADKNILIDILREMDFVEAVHEDQLTKVFNPPAQQVILETTFSSTQTTIMMPEPANASLAVFNSNSVTTSLVLGESHIDGDSSDYSAEGEGHPAIIQASFSYEPPTDPLFPLQWSLSSKGVNAEQGWKELHGEDVETTVVAVIDSGIDLHNVELEAKIWKNNEEICNNEVDDDHNGYIDDCDGWDFTRNAPNPQDEVGHGTGVAGIIGAVTNNKIGIASMCWNCKIMALKVADFSGYIADSSVLSAIDYALTKKVKISNNSYGGASVAFQVAVRRSQQQGMLFVAAAGNNGISIDSDGGTPIYPAASPFSNVVSVAATNEVGNLASWSNHGLKTVTLAAPGERILTTGLEETYVYNDGTSFAAPHVTGLAALIWSRAPHLNYLQVIWILIVGARPLRQLQEFCVTGAIIDAQTSLVLTEKARYNGLFVDMEKLRLSSNSTPIPMDVDV